MYQEFEQAKTLLHKANDMAEVKNSPIVESTLMPLIKVVPIIGDLIDSSLNKVIEDFQKNKEREFIEVILKDRYTITSEMVNDVEFIFNYAKALEAVKRLASNDKVKYFGNLIRKGYLSGEHITNNEFEEYLDILSSMSYREIEYLVGYKLFCEKQSKRKEKVHDNWQGYLCDYVDGMNEEEQMSVFYMLPKLIRTGFVEEVYETEEGWVNTEDNQLRIDTSRVNKTGYRLTMSFDRFYEMVLELEE